MAEGNNHLEEVEHQSHAISNPFDRRIALTMVIIAAALSVVKVLGHRAHSETLRLQIESNVKHTKESDQWAFFQAQKIRQHLYEGQLKYLDLFAKEKNHGPEVQAVIDSMEKKVTEYQTKADDIQKQANSLLMEGEDLQEKSIEMHHRTNFFDFGEMGVELALVLCSLAILIRQTGFWYAGMIVALLGVIFSSIGLLPTPGKTHHATEKHSSLSRGSF